MKNFKNTLKYLIKDESGQGMTEYILLVVVILAIGFLFKKQIVDAVSSKVSEVGGQIGSFSTGNN